jgi:hypothetical protein
MGDPWDEGRRSTQASIVHLHLLRARKVSFLLVMVGKA